MNPDISVRIIVAYHNLKINYMYNVSLCLNVYLLTDNSYDISNLIFHQKSRRYCKFFLSAPVMTGTLMVLRFEPHSGMSLILVFYYRIPLMN